MELTSTSIADIGQPINSTTDSGFGPISSSVSVAFAVAGSSILLYVVLMIVKGCVSRRSTTKQFRHTTFDQPSATSTSRRGTATPPAFNVSMDTEAEVFPRTGSITPEVTYKNLPAVGGVGQFEHKCDVSSTGSHGNRAANGNGNEETDEDTNHYMNYSPYLSMETLTQARTPQTTPELGLHGSVRQPSPKQPTMRRPGQPPPPPPAPKLLQPSSKPPLPPTKPPPSPSKPPPF